MIKLDTDMFAMSLGSRRQVFRAFRAIVAEIETQLAALLMLSDNLTAERDIARWLPEVER